jgi:hypothetical protein
MNVATWLYLIWDKSDQNKLADTIAECPYEAHPIETIMWELYRKGEVPLGSVLYFVGRLNSKSIGIDDCLSEKLPEYWGD